MCTKFDTLYLAMILEVLNVNNNNNNEENNSRNTIDSAYKAVLSKRFGDRVKKIMDERNITQAELARRAGMSRSVVNNMLKGTRNPSLFTALMVARALNVSLDDLTSGDIYEITDVNDTIRKMFKIDFLRDLAKVVNNAEYYSNQFIELSQEQKDTILRLVYAYLNVSPAGDYRGSKDDN